MRVAQNLDDRPSDGVSARPRAETCRRSYRRRQREIFGNRRAGALRGGIGQTGVAVG
jgi:hypothetical protein